MKQKINTPYGKATIYRNTSGSAARIAIVPGYSESITHNKELVDTLASQGGYDVFTFSQPRKGAAAHPLDRQRDIILRVLEAGLKDGETVHAVAHSLGAAALLRAARKHPEWFASLILMQPSGIGDAQTFMQLARRVGKKTTKNHLGALRKAASTDKPFVYSVAFRQIARANATSTAHVIRNPLLALKEARVAISHIIADDIAAVKAMGTPVHIVVVPDDELFATESLHDYDQAIELPGSYSSVAHADARHDTFWMHPQQTAHLIDTFIRHSRNQTGVAPAPVSPGASRNKA